MSKYPTKNNARKPFYFNSRTNFNNQTNQPIAENAAHSFNNDVNSSYYSPFSSLNTTMTNAPSFNNEINRSERYDPLEGFCYPNRSSGSDSQLINQRADYPILPNVSSQHNIYNNSVVVNSNYGGISHNPSSASSINTYNHSTVVNNYYSGSTAFNNRLGAVNVNLEPNYSQIQQELPPLHFVDESISNENNAKQPLTTEQKYVRTLGFKLTDVLRPLKKSLVKPFNNDYGQDDYLNAIARLMNTTAEDGCTSICITDKHLLVSNINEGNTASLSARNCIKILYEYFDNPFSDGYNKLMNYAVELIHYNITSNDRIIKRIDGVFGSHHPTSVQEWIDFKNYNPNLSRVHSEVVDAILEPITDFNIIVESFSKGLIDIRLIEAIKNYGNAENIGCNFLFVEGSNMLHAEMKILEYLNNHLETNKGTFSYKLGISHNCCAYCYIAINKLQENSQEIMNEELHFDIPGVYGKFIAGWIPPKFLAKYLKTTFEDLLKLNPQYDLINNDATINGHLNLNHPFITSYSSIKDLENGIEEIMQLSGITNDKQGIINLLKGYQAEINNASFTNEQKQNITHNIHLLEDEWGIIKGIDDLKDFAYFYQNGYTHLPATSSQDDVIHDLFYQLIGEEASMV